MSDRRTRPEFPDASQSYFFGTIAIILLITNVTTRRLTTTGGFLWDWVTRSWESSWKNWAIAAQEYYSFLGRLENNDLENYQDDLWDYHYDRLSINLISIWGDDTVDNLSFKVDEQALTVDLSKSLGAVSPSLYYPFDGGLTSRY